MSVTSIFRKLGSMIFPLFLYFAPIFYTDVLNWLLSEHQMKLLALWKALEYDFAERSQNCPARPKSGNNSQIGQKNYYGYVSWQMQKIKT